MITWLKELAMIYYWDFTFRLVVYSWVQDQKSPVIIREGLHEIKWQPQFISREQVLNPRAAIKAANKESVKYIENLILHFQFSI